RTCRRNRAQHQSDQAACAKRQRNAIARAALNGDDHAAWIFLSTMGPRSDGLLCAFPPNRLIMLFRLQIIPTRQLSTAGDQTSAAFVGEICPCPLDQNNDPVPETDQEEDVDEQPGKPRQESGNMNFAELRHCCGSSNRGQTTLVQVVKILSRISLQFACDVLCSCFTLLHGDWRQTG